jgi:hypothetical protein
VLRPSESPAACGTPPEFAASPGSPGRLVSRLRTGVHLGVHNPRTLQYSSDSSDTGKGNELNKSFVRCLSPVALKSLDPLGRVGSTPTPGTNLRRMFVSLSAECRASDSLRP